MTIKNALPIKCIDRLKKLSNKLTEKKSRPIFVVKQQELGQIPEERYTNTGIQAAIKKAEPILKTNLGNHIVILSNKVLLRRTWPMSEDESKGIRHNASNLAWHQDSNPKHNDKPMVVIMISLDKGFGESRPGISILKTRARNFEGIYGYQGDMIERFEKKVKDYEGVETLPAENPVLDIGEMVVFNGLTFHRTFSTKGMVGTRDALLIRAVRWTERKNFPEGPHLIVKYEEN